jgi:hypothetical protein
MTDYEFYPTCNPLAKVTPERPAVLRDLAAALTEAD